MNKMSKTGMIALLIPGISLAQSTIVTADPPVPANIAAAAVIVIALAVFAIMVYVRKKS